MTVEKENLIDKETLLETKIDTMRLLFQLQDKLSSKFDEMKKSHAEEKNALNSQIEELKISNGKEKENYKLSSTLNFNIVLQPSGKPFYVLIELV